MMTPLDKLIDDKFKEVEQALRDYKSKLAVFRELLEIRKKIEVEINE